MPPPRPTPPKLVDDAGRPLAVGAHLGTGGEGSVYELAADPGRVVKVYHAPPADRAAAKLAEMAARAGPALAKVAAWPERLVFHPAGRRLAGFVMPRVSDAHPVQRLYNPVERVTWFPRAGLKMQVRAARNLAAAFDEVHTAGCLVADVNQSNALVTAGALVWLIDCDSFQVPAAGGGVFPCDVGVPLYTPPELQGQTLRGRVRTPNHDRFGLAVLIYQLLFVGRHPYAGVYSGKGDPSFAELIADFRFAQGPAAAAWGMAPPPHTPTFDDVPGELAGLFRKAFEKGSDRPDARPSALDWVSALDLLEPRLTACGADPGHQFWPTARGCVWCRLRAGRGPDYYYGAGGAAAAEFKADEAGLAAALARLAACRPDAFDYDRAAFVPPALPPPTPLPADLDDRRLIERVVAAMFVVCLAAVPCGVFRGWVACVGLIGAVVYGVWYAALVWMSPRRREVRARRSRRDAARRAVREAERRWAGRADQYRRDHAQLTADAHRLVAKCRRLTDDYRGEIRRRTDAAEAAGRDRHLRLHQVADADIPGIGAVRKQALAAHGVATAADVDEAVVRGIRGFGDVLTGKLVAWKEDVAKGYKFDPAAALSPGEQQAVTVRFDQRQRALLAELRDKASAVEQAAADCRADTAAIAEALRRAIAGWHRAEADLKLVRDGGRSG